MHCIDPVIKAPDLRVPTISEWYGLYLFYGLGPHAITVHYGGEKEFPLADEVDMPAPFSEDVYEYMKLYDNLAEAIARMPHVVREQLEEWTEVWSKQGLPMRGWHGP